MKNKYLFPIFVLCTLCSQIAVTASDDIQLWSKFGTSFKVDDGSAIKTSIEARIYEDMQKLDTWEWYVGYEKKVSWGKWAIGGKRGEKDHRKDDPKYYNSLLLDFTPSWKLENGWSFSWRSRFEAKDAEGADDWAYRYRAQIGFAKGIKNAGSLNKFAIKNEAFYDLHGGGLNVNRFYPVVLSFKISDKVKLDVYGMLHSKKKSGDWGHDYILGTSLGF